MKNYMAKVAGLGCLICRGPAEIHHVRFGQGMSQRASDYLIIPLCPVHHRTGGFGIAIHAGQKQFELQHGSANLSCWRRPSLELSGAL